MPGSPSRPSAGSPMVDQDTGVVLIVVGLVLAALGFLFPPICALGILLLIIGTILALVGQPRPVYYPAPPAYPYGMPAAPGAPQVPPCAVCGSPLTWIGQYGRWYCARCQAYR